MIVCVPKVFASTFTVNQSGDAGDLTCDATCTLRDAVQAANASPSGDTILFVPNVSTVVLTSEIVIANNGSLTITGAGADTQVIDGGSGTNRIFWINPNAVVAITDVTLTGGNGTGGTFHKDGGAVYSNSASLTLDRVYVAGNSSDNWGGGVAIEGGSNNRILNSTIAQNSAVSACGGFYSTGPVTVVNSIISGNSTTFAGGGGLCNFSTMVLRNVTVTGNVSPNPGGISQQSGNLNLGNTIVAGNTSTNNQQHEIYVASAGGVTSAGNNLIGSSAGRSTNTFNAIAYQGTDLRDVSPQFINIGYYGGKTPTVPLQYGSPARDTGSNALAIDPSNGNAAITSDERGPGFARSVNATGGAARVDIGAFEIQDVRYYVTQYFVTLPAGACDDACYLREAITAVPAGGIVDFDGFSHQPRRSMSEVARSSLIKA
ncbi:MAG: choice-of-anchor Q domain-containing protein [Pyrinomonadaceae bacterium]